ncbi:hypothetical protein P152DRAFT_474763 [Eremomyces bilateralis CBS 781.70]|uniref:Uncharacterized protein n=1 Tax=Eremomyces bilateralis CBS 781.70 TaxID=1392243 RepID=A0A6G1G0N2_9PEZI|nr:uncharacterized protein P152DRAFT_474763 [Eremomyces bilateralis CBS 781.70]KAF1811614.1 hypothetical protein P152DRAFT_474763 [Eremomyces bilateralis CBS 781.70]
MAIRRLKEMQIATAAHLTSLEQSTTQLDREEAYESEEEVRFMVEDLQDQMAAVEETNGEQQTKMSRVVESLDVLDREDLPERMMAVEEVTGEQGTNVSHVVERVNLLARDKDTYEAALAMESNLDHINRRLNFAEKGLRDVQR